MDLVLLQPGDPQAVGLGDNSWETGGSLIDGLESAVDLPWSGFGEKEATDSPLAFDGKNCIELVSINQGLKQQITTDVSNSARTSGRPIITDFTCVKYVDKSSVKFNELCLRAWPLGKGKDQPTKIYILRNSGDRLANIITIQLRDAIISEIQFQTHPDDMPTEQFKLNFTEILWTYNVQRADTTAGGVFHAGWSVAKNRPIGGFTD
jgi:type VI secretion system secreted protein Hcp